MKNDIQMKEVMDKLERTLTTVEGRLTVLSLSTD